MKTRKLTLIYLTLIATLVLGIFAVEVLSGPKKARVKGWFYPRTYTLGTPLPDTWDVWLKFAPPRSVDEIDTETIRLEDRYEPCKPYPYDLKNRVVVPFKAKDVLRAAIEKLVHDGFLLPGSYLVYLEVTGLLKDGTPFSTGMSSVIVLYVPEPNPP